MNVILNAARFAAKLHEGQTRKYNGRPYIEHPNRIAGRVANRMDSSEEMVAAAFLHDTLEDCDVNAAQIATVCNFTVARIVSELTNPSKGSRAPRAERKQMDREHIAKASQEARVIKLLDRIDNLNEMVGCDPQFAVKYAEESRLLLKALRRTDESLEDELAQAIAALVETVRAE